MRALLALILLAAAPAIAAPEVTPAGDGGGVRVTLANSNVQPVESGVGPADGAVPHRPVPGYGEAAWFVQCVDGRSGPAPKLRGGAFHELAPLTVPPTAFAKGPPVLLVAHRGPERAAVQRALGEGGPPVEAVSPADLPTTFAAIRFAPLLLISASDLDHLPPEGRASLRAAVAAGSTLVVAAGDGAEPADLLKDLAPVRLGELERPGPALRGALPACTGRIGLVPEAGAVVRVEADGAPVVVEAALGLGRVRVTSVRFADLEPGRLASTLLGVPADPIGPVLTWLSQRPPLLPQEDAPLRAWTWALPLAIGLLGLLARRRPVTALALVPLPVLAGAILSPVGAPETADEAVVLYVPVPGGAVAVGTIDLTLVAGGGRALPAAGATIALEDASPAGACVAAAPDAAWWIVSGEPGERRRLTFFSLLATAPQAGAAAEALPSWPAGPLAEAPLAAVDGPTPLPIELPPGRVTARLLKPPPLAADPPWVLPVPAEAPPTDAPPTEAPLR